MSLQAAHIDWPSINFGPVNLWSLAWYRPVTQPSHSPTRSKPVISARQHQEMKRVLGLRG
ncbi:cyclopropane-fatty-acyl-phospholipid synthase [Novimethylophilus kurashikiensis]|uniref:Cyclopropane-fatty-acyl-phospholipid synthase n=1 Tax=Novimethylophilus kurashikiensis TaxID=1825523 RepID=A0A2R5FBL6_9PROT|nr:cyclopropane-fatty-acyl-phospholipid synthase [Novimethylophilus kurashikiensis]